MFDKTSVSNNVIKTNWYAVKPGWDVQKSEEGEWKDQKLQKVYAYRYEAFWNARRWYTIKTRHTSRYGEVTYTTEGPYFGPKVSNGDFTGGGAGVAVAGSFYFYGGTLAKDNVMRYYTGDSNATTLMGDYAKGNIVWVSGSMEYAEHRALGILWYPVEYLIFTEPYRTSDSSYDDERKAAWNANPSVRWINFGFTWGE
jgi:hypothetical protein